MSPDRFARRMRSLADGIPKRANEVQRKVAVAVSQTVTLATPVDTGRARANWQVTLSAPATQATSETDPGGQSTLDKHRAVIASQRDEDIWLSNNVPYIRRLNDGYSAQAPAGFIEAAVQAGVAAVRRSKLLK